ncbi:Endonuclease/exonuclease/phosphatase family protein [Quillaja saponaria]|uniref:Endonuclease/exonuclease/phosphatase family protein n=1 Tax=Quillaja saponaria TaxID=32244 RepID=A0AAD7LUW6_QUISA|nr:Endonuclease/exonuclease/phosphatase family protein [Quillaja saponaria]
MEDSDSDSEDDSEDKSGRDLAECPTIRLIKEEEKRLRDPLKHSLIVKLLGKRIGYGFLCKKLYQIWKPKGVLKLIHLASTSFIRVAKMLIRTHRHDILVILEPRISGDKAVHVILKLGFDMHQIDDVVGFSSGIGILWDNVKVKLQVETTHSQFIHCKIQEGLTHSWSFTAIYENPRLDIRDDCWNTSQSILGPWYVAGDFNEIAMSNEKMGGTSCKLAIANLETRFKIASFKILGAKGPKYTWKGSNQGFYGHVFKRLDRALANSDWVSQFPQAVVKVLPRIKSDHNLLLVDTTGLINYSGQKPFRFEAIRITHKDISIFINAQWDHPLHITEKLNKIVDPLKR